MQADADREGPPLQETDREGRSTDQRARADLGGLHVTQAEMKTLRQAPPAAHALQFDSAVSNISSQQHHTFQQYQHHPSQEHRQHRIWAQGERKAKQERCWVRSCGGGIARVRDCARMNKYS